MPNLSDLSRKALACEIANYIYINGAATQNLDSLCSELTPPVSIMEDANSSFESTQTAKPRKIGIWIPAKESDKASYVRDTQRSAEWTYWASVHEIPPKSDKKRVILLGESVARGYLFDPYYNPGQVLESIVNASGYLNVEVIDLAKTNLDLIGLSELAEECLELKPDSIIIFAGNNWIYSLKRSLAEQDIVCLNQAFESTGVKGLEAFLVEKFKLLIHKHIDKIINVTQANNIPIIFIIPEFNLADWKSNKKEQILTALPNEDLKQWYNAKQDAEDAFAAGNWESVCSEGEKMIALDCSHPAGYEIVAESKIKLGLFKEARKYLESTRDTALFNRAATAPRPHTAVRETLTEISGEYGVSIVDLPEIFMQHNGEILPGRELFLDYCHLSEEGIKIAMTATARELIYVLTKNIVDPSDLKAGCFGPDSDVKAIAHVFAAIHNAHYGQAHDVLNYLCETAIKASPVATKVMSNFVDFASRRTNTTLCKSHENLIESEIMNQYAGGVGLLHKTGKKIIDIPLVDAMLAALNENGIDYSEKIDALRKKEHSIRNGKINLLESFYTSSAYDIYLGKAPQYFQSRDVESTFLLIASSGENVSLKMTYRTPRRCSPQDKIKIYINDSILAEMMTTETWVTSLIKVSPASLKDGINAIKIIWSTTFDFKEYVRETEINDDSIFKALFNVYGEIIHFIAIPE